MTLPAAADGTQGTPSANLPEARAPLPTLFEVVRSQLGLNLELTKGPLELIVIDHVEKTPTEN
jgi:uncharacterized protein (TIGR03435 family)